MHDWYFLELIIVKKYMLATCRKLFEIIFQGSYMRIIPQHMSRHVRDTCMKFLGINKCKFYMLVTCRQRFRINLVSFSSTMVIDKKSPSLYLRSEARAAATPIASPSGFRVRSSPLLRLRIRNACGSDVPLRVLWRLVLGNHAARQKRPCPI